VKAIAFSRYGEPDVLQLIDVDVPPTGARQVRVRVIAAGVQSFECKLRSGELAG
jgi:NADPH:quinone reductase-like Zn-dependent oxidoreductase